MTRFQTQLNSTNQLATSIQDARIAKNMTQTDLSTITGIPRPWINQLEQGHIKNPGFTRILKLMNALEMSLSVSYSVNTAESESTEGKTSAVSMLNALSDAYTSLARGLGQSIQTSLANPAVIKALEQRKNIEQSNFAKISKLLSKLYENSGHNYTSTYTTLLNRSKLIEQQAKELDENDPDSRESDNRNNEEA